METRILTLGDMDTVQVYNPRISAAGGDWWNPNGDIACVWAAYQPKGAASLAASYTDLTGNGNNAGVGVAPTWDAVNGWIFNGTTQYLTTTFVPQNDQTQSMIVQFTNGTTAYTYLCGVSGGSNRWFSIYPSRRADLDYLAYSNGTIVTQAPRLLAGNLAVAGNQGYRNGVADGGAIGAWVGSTTRVIYIGALNSGSAGLFSPAYIQAFALYDCTLTAPQVLAVATAMAAL